MNSYVDPSSCEDRLLVERHLAGAPDAFRQIVERHQGAVCAVAYSACGDLARSEDLAQETFVAAWRQLPELREPEKLRGWLCGIVRNLVRSHFRRNRSNPVARAEELPHEVPQDEADPGVAAMSAEEMGLMWRTLAGIPENYREPMVLFYREQQSVAAVAAALDISEETVRQRLARGRTMLSERMAKRVGRSLARSAPKAGFAGAIMVAVAEALSPAEAKAASGAGLAGGKMLAAAKGGFAIKLGATAAALPMLLTSLTDYLRFRAQLGAASPEMRQKAVRDHALPLLRNGALLLLVALSIIGGSWFGRHLSISSAEIFAVVVAMAFLIARFQRGRAGGENAAKDEPSHVFEFRSRREWLGLPWIHIRAGGADRWRHPVRGWIAIGDGVAMGGFFASGSIALAPVSVGGMALGLAAMGGVVVGIGALGVVASGWLSAGAVAAALQAAWGAIALSFHYAVGGLARAAEANTATAQAYIAGHSFFHFAESAWRVAAWALFLTWLPPLVLILLHRPRRSLSGEK